VLKTNNQLIECQGWAKGLRLTWTFWSWTKSRMVASINDLIAKNVQRQNGGHPVQMDLTAMSVPACPQR